MPTQDAPRWVRWLDDTRWFGNAGPGKREMFWVEVFLVTTAAVLLAASFLVHTQRVAQVLRAGALFQFVVAWLVGVYWRLCDRYDLWPHGPPPQRTREQRVAEYVYAFGQGFAAIAVILWVMQA